ncbi:MAG: hypothetical protein ACI9K2_005800 [Myxococcota bacterium]|jgi:hypothetical protein
MGHWGAHGTRDRAIARESGGRRRLWGPVRKGCGARARLGRVRAYVQSGPHGHSGASHYRSAGSAPRRGTSDMRGLDACARVRRGRGGSSRLASRSTNTSGRRRTPVWPLRHGCLNRMHTRPSSSTDRRWSDTAARAVYRTNRSRPWRSSAATLTPACTSSPAQRATHRRWRRSTGPPAPTATALDLPRPPPPGPAGPARPRHGRPRSAPASGRLLRH